MSNDKRVINVSVKFTYEDGSSSDSVLLEDLKSKELIALMYLLNGELNEDHRSNIKCYCNDENNCDDCFGTSIKEYKHRVKTVNGEWD